MKLDPLHTANTTVQAEFLETICTVMWINDDALDGEMIAIVKHICKFKLFSGVPYSQLPSDCAFKVFTRAIYDASEEVMPGQGQLLVDRVSCALSDPGTDLRFNGNMDKFILWKYGEIPPICSVKSYYKL